MRKTIPVLAFFAMLGFAFAANAKMPHAGHKPAEDVIGLWYTEDHEGIVQIYPCDDKICGRLYWMKASDVENASVDNHNPDPGLRHRPLCKMQFMGDFAPDGEGHYSDGWIYSPRHGQTFGGDITVVDHNTIHMHGYVWFPVLGQDQTWTRAKKQKSCAGRS